MEQNKIMNGEMNENELNNVAGGGFLGNVFMHTDRCGRAYAQVNLVSDPKITCKSFFLRLIRH